MSEARRYSTVAQYLHWIIAGLIVGQYALANIAEEAEHTASQLELLALWANHKSVGITVLFLAIVRLAWRLFHAPPALSGSLWQVRAAHWAHIGLYGLLFVVPISGWLMSSASAYSVSWFSLLTLPDLVGPSEQLKDLFEEIHEACVGLLFVVALVHILAALWHRFRLRDDVMRSMWTWVGGAVALMICVLVIALLGSAPGSNTTTTNATNATSDGEMPSELSEALKPFSAGAADPWQIDYEQSSITFTAEQAGALFEGNFESWQADIRFDPEDLANSSAQVDIELSSVSTNDADRDGALVEPDWFGDSSGQFRASTFATQNSGQFNATDATLAMGGTSMPIQFEFNVVAEVGAVTLTGHARLDRLALGIGQGDWLDTTWVGQYVDVSVTVRATR